MFPCNHDDGERFKVYFAGGDERVTEGPRNSSLPIKNELLLYYYQDESVDTDVDVTLFPLTGISKLNVSFLTWLLCLFAFLP